MSTYRTFICLSFHKKKTVLYRLFDFRRLRLISIAMYLWSLGVPIARDSLFRENGSRSSVNSVVRRLRNYYSQGTCRYWFSGVGVTAFGATMVKEQYVPAWAHASIRATSPRTSSVFSPYHATAAVWRIVLSTAMPAGLC